MTTPAAGSRRNGRSFAQVATAIRHLLAEHRLLRFLLVGGFNTAFGYGLFVLALAVLPTTFAALSVSTILAVLFSFVTTGSYVFHSRDSRRLLAFALVYALVFTYNAIGLAALERSAVAPWVGGLVLLPGAVAISYFLNSRYTFGRS